MIDISNEVFTKLKRDLAVKVIRDGETSNPEFPCVTFSELPISDKLETVSSGGVNAYNVGFQVQIYTTGNRKITESKSIRDNVNELMSGFYGMTLVSANQLENYADPSIFRYVMRYECTVDINKTIYRR